MDYRRLISLGASPRATIFIARASKVKAFLSKRSYVIPEDIKSVATSILRHRIIPSYEAEAEEMTSDHIIQRIFETIPIP